MESNEIRIGNYINNIEFGNVIVYGVNFEMFQYERLDTIYYGNVFDFEPIPIKEEWLLLFGFEKKEHICSDKSISKGLFFKNGYYIQNSKEGFLFCQLHYSGQGWFIKNIKYIHQLQNLYFALTQTELTLS